MGVWTPPSEALNHSPTELCPHPEWWTAWNPVSTEVEVSMLVAAFVKAMQPEFVLEIGSHWGQTTERIAQVIRENKHGHFTSLEIREDFCGSTRARCAELPEAVIIQVDSLEFIPPWPIDLLFIDGAEENRFKDYRHYLPYLSSRPTILVHDTDYYTDQAQIIIGDWYLLGGNHISLHTPRGLLILTR